MYARPAGAAHGRKGDLRQSVFVLGVGVPALRARLGLPAEDEDVSFFGAYKP
jgi:hypothetical protein